MVNLLPGHRHSKSNLFSKVNDVAHGLAAVKGVYDAGNLLYNAGRSAAAFGRAAYPFIAGAGILA